MSAIFISHSNKDNTAAGEVKEWLGKHGHQSVFLDFDPCDGIPTGRIWEKELYARLRGCQAVIVLCSEYSMNSHWCFAEITMARSLGKHIFPLKVAACQVSPLLGDLQLTDITRKQSEGYQQLISGLKKVGLDPSDLFDWDGTRPPYPGLLAFQEQDAAIYFGRDVAINDTLETLYRLQCIGGARLALILGASGSGKSSLIRAGVVPRLKRDKDRWLVLEPFRPQDKPFDMLAMVFASAFATLDSPRNWKPIRDDLKLVADTDDKTHLIELVNDLLVAAGRLEATVLFVIDQFEELLAQSTSSSANRFFEFLDTILNQLGSKFLIVGTLRSDFLGAFQTHKITQNLLYEPIHLRQMALNDFSQVIEKPAIIAGGELEPGLAQTIIADTATDDALPLLAFTMHELWNCCNSLKCLTLDAYQNRLGGLQGSIARRADSVFSGCTLSVVEELQLRNTFLSMVRVDAEGWYIRRQVLWADLPFNTHDMLEKFVKARLFISVPIERRDTSIKPPKS